LFIKRNTPNLEIEQGFSNQVVVGIDEVGRGPLAGPLVVGAVILDKASIPMGINDSKQLTKNQREKIYDKLIVNTQYGIGIVDVFELDQLKLTLATELAIMRAVEDLGKIFDIALIDGNINYKLPFKTISIIKGDQKSLSIAAASIIAKVTRDRIMYKLANNFNNYGWEKNVGYGTKHHMQAIEDYGITIHHRKSFAPINKLIANKD
jgi:ribonuclease HII